MQLGSVAVRQCSSWAVWQLGSVAVGQCGSWAVWQLDSFDFRIFRRRWCFKSLHSKS